MSEWGNPLKPKKAKKDEKELALFKQEKLILTKSEAKKVLGSSQDLSRFQIAWTQRWLDQRVRERSLPPQLSGADAFGSMSVFLPPHEVIHLLDEIRADFQRTLPYQPKDDYPIEALESVEYHRHLPEPSF